MASFSPKSYQKASLEMIGEFFLACHNSATASEAFSKTIQEKYGKNWGYRSLHGFDANMPYFCIRMPTGGGKTWTAAKAVKIVNKYLSPREYGVILWLTPRDAICAQTLAGFKNPAHPLYAALSEAGPVSVMSLDEAKSLRPQALDSTIIIVATRQAFQVEKEKNRHVYQGSGELMQHFENLPPEVEANLLPATDENGVELEPRLIPKSLVNVLRMLRPFIIVDEAHNNRTELAFDTLAKFLPSGIMELTATPDISKNPSNVLYSVSAAELKNENMVKLPIILTPRDNLEQCLAEAIAKRDELQAIADSEREFGSERMRPVVLIQAEPRSQTKDTLHCEAIKEELIRNQRIPEKEICIATGDSKGLEQLNKEYPKGITDPACPVKYIITQKALAEGWDCPWAYILVSAANTSSATAVEQLLGRILRQPGARKFAHEALNQSYAYVVSDNFAAAANNLRDQLVRSAGFERCEASQFVLRGENWQPELFSKEIPVANPAAISPVPAALHDKIEYQQDKGQLVLKAKLSSQELQVLQPAIRDTDLMAEICAYSRGSGGEPARPEPVSPSEIGAIIRIPQLSLEIKRGGETVREPFIDAAGQLLPMPSLKPEDARPTEAEIASLALERGGAAKIDVDAKGKLQSEFLKDVQLALDFAYQPENWNSAQLCAWLCAKVEAIWLRHDLKYAFILSWLEAALARMPLGQAVRKKMAIRNLLETRLNELKLKADEEAGQRLLLSPKAGEIFKVDDQFGFEYSRYAYYPVSRYDPAKWGNHVFKKHYYPEIGDFDSREEFECAQFIDREAQAGRIKYWVRNLVKTPNSFALKKIDGKFYPDFVCVLPNEKILVVEYKGADRWDTPKVKADRQIGQLWAELSGGKCEFVMLKNRDWARISKKLA